MAPNADRARLRDLPSVDQVATAAGCLTTIPTHLLTSVARAEIDHARRRICLGGPVPNLEVLAQASALRAELLVRDDPRPVVNGTGVIIHTNLGRAPLSNRALAAIQAVGAGYASLEIDLDTGHRGVRGASVAESFHELTGSESALVLNNNAGATFLALEALTSGSEVLVSRGEAIEIGGGFRIPDILTTSGAELRDVGTTNRTKIKDYADAINDRTSAILHVHRSNFTQVGFTESPKLGGLADLAHSHGIPLISDIGSGTLLDPQPFGLASEPRVQDALAAGSNLVTFSGDKLLGGPQAGIIVGDAELVTQIARRPLARTLRPDALTLAGLRATLTHYLLGEAIQEIPVWQMIAAHPPDLYTRAKHLARGVPGATIEPCQSAVGGGSLPGQVIPSFAICLSGHPAGSKALAARLRSGEPPIVSRVTDETVVLDVRTILTRDDAVVHQALRDLPG